MPYVLLNIIVVLVIAGLILWAIGQFPLDATIAKLIKVVVVVVVCIYLLYFLVGLVPAGAPLLPYHR